MFFHEAPGAGPVWTPGARLAGSQWELMTPGAGPFLTPGARLAGFIKRTTIHCYTQNMKALGLVVSEKIFLCFSMMLPGRGPYGPQGHGWQDL